MGSRSEVERDSSSNPKTFTIVFISIVGAGFLGRHYTFMRTRGSLTIAIVAFLTYHYMMLLVLSRCRFEETNFIEEANMEDKVMNRPVIKTIKVII
ncbi:hypothetical protein QJS10_CPB20g00473 [Acorus calamus]|uniref:TM2 domain-containing protein n=1 Tax=Acorus calamus TaxID=4465 RepID=A0AAV9CAP2_ACOCL|nr:hypothetical protein QJS10_CPB20g00473 [Acorus calamus]